MIQTDFEKLASKVLYEHKSEFNKYVLNKQKIYAIKSLKEYTGGGLKECKDVMDLYFSGDYITYITEDRKNKLEHLAKKPLVEEVSLKMSILTKDDIEKILMNMTTDQLFDIVENIDKIQFDKKI